MGDSGSLGGREWRPPFCWKKTLCAATQPEREGVLRYTSERPRRVANGARWKSLSGRDFRADAQKVWSWGVGGGAVGGGRAVSCV